MLTRFISPISTGPDVATPSGVIVLYVLSYGPEFMDTLLNSSSPEITLGY